MKDREQIESEIGNVTSHFVNPTHSIFKLLETGVRLLLDIRDELAELNNRAKEQKREAERQTRKMKR